MTRKVTMDEAAPIRRRVGRRLEIAARLAGYETTISMAEAMGIDQGTISRWWRGERLPSAPKLELYGRLVDQTPAWFYREISDEDSDRLLDLLTEIVDLAQRGATLDTAFAQVTGRTDEIGRRDREQIAAGTPAVRAAVTEAAGQDWEALSPSQRRAAVRKLRARVDE